MSDEAPSRLLSVRIDPDKCQGHARCWAVSPEVFDVDDRGYGLVRPDVDPSHFPDQVRRAEQNCPELAIEVAEIGPDTAG
jgi:ferredoxin